jgi:hypothetical protein
MHGNNDDVNVRLCCCGSQLEAVERFRDGRSIGYFCKECESVRMKTFFDNPNEPETTDADV